VSNEDKRDAILARFTCAHIRLTRAPTRGGDGQDGFQWAPGCVHPKMHLRFTGEPGFCDRCPCYTARAGLQR